MKKTFFIFIALTFFSISLIAQQKNLPGAYSPEVTKNFAFDLYQTGFLEEAETEFRRYLFTTDKIDETAIITLGTIYNQKDNLSGINWITDNFYPRLTLKTNEKISLIHGRLIFKTLDLQSFTDFQNFLEPDFSKFSLDFQNIILISQNILQKDIDKAKENVAAAKETNVVFSYIEASLNDYKLKKPGLALGLSLVCPGAGKMYVGSFGQGFSSFLTFASFTSAAVYTGIDSHWKSWRPYVFGTGSLVIYIVEAYGAYQAARRYNATLYRELCESTDYVYEELF